jgi:hypothetical protein
MAKIILFQDINFGGSSLIVQSPDTSLVPQGWNDAVSSLIVIDGQWSLYDDINYGGTQWSVSASGGPSGDGTYPDWADWGGTNDSISSLKPA